MLDFDKNGVVKVSKDGKEMASSQCTFTGSVVSLTDIGGEAATKEKGVYQFSCDGKELTFRRIEDNAGGRAAVLSTYLWRNMAAGENAKKERGQEN